MTVADVARIKRQLWEAVIGEDTPCVMVAMVELTGAIMWSNRDLINVTRQLEIFCEQLNNCVTRLKTEGNTRDR